MGFFLQHESVSFGSSTAILTAFHVLLVRVNRSDWLPLCRCPSPFSPFQSIARSLSEYWPEFCVVARRESNFFMPRR